MAMWREMPSGREEAIETLVDMDPQGNFFRAARVLVSCFGSFCRIELLTIYIKALSFSD